MTVSSRIITRQKFCPLKLISVSCFGIGLKIRLDNLVDYLNIIFKKTYAFFTCRFLYPQQELWKKLINHMEEN